MIRRFATAAALAILAVLAFVLATSPFDAPGAAAQEFGGGSTRLARTAFEPPTAAPGGTARLVLEISIDPGQHLYAQSAADVKRPTFEWKLPPGWTAGKLEDVSTPHDYDDAGEMTKVHEGTAVLAQSFTLAADAAVGDVTITGTGAWQYCDASTCKFMRNVPVVAKVAVVAAAAAAAAPGVPAPAPKPEDEDPARVTKVAFDAPTVAAGGAARLVVEFAIQPTWHLYWQGAPDEQRPVFTWKLPKGWTVGPVTDVSPVHDYDDDGEKVKVHEGTAVLAQAFALAADAAPGATEIAGTVSWLACSDICIPAKDVPLKATVEVVAAGPVSATATTTVVVGPPPAAGAGDAAEGASSGADSDSKGWSGVLWSGFIAGLITLLTPCVFPLLPVTVSFFSKQKGPALPRSLVYGLGIVFTITVIGLIFKTGLDQMARGWQFNLFVGVLFLVLALSLFGLFDLRLPGFLTNWSQSKAGGTGLAGPFFMAVTLALTSFSCSMPFLATMFTQFEEGNHAQSVAGLVVYGSTMAFPFVLCSLFPAAIQTIPRAGAWMNAVKVTMGFVEFGLAFKFLRTVCLNFGWEFLPRSLVLAIWIACALGAALYLFGYVVLPHDTKVESIGVFRLIAALVFLSLALYMLPGLWGRPLAVDIESFIQTSPSDLTAGGRGGPGAGHTAAGPRGPGGAVVPAAHEDEWPRNDWDGALARAKLAQRPLLLDFTGVG